MAGNHSQLINEILLLISIEGIRAWKNETGVARSFDRQRVMKYGLKGSADILGIVKCKSGVGAFLAIEVKTGKDTQRTEQQRFQAMIEKHGGLYILAKDTDILNQVQTFQLNN